MRDNSTNKTSTNMAPSAPHQKKFRNRVPYTIHSSGQGSAYTNQTQKDACHSPVIICLNSRETETADIRPS